MTGSITCLKCKAKFPWQAKLANSLSQCPHCGNVFTMPSTAPRSITPSDEKSSNRQSFQPVTGGFSLSLTPPPPPEVPPAPPEVSPGTPPIISPVVPDSTPLEEVLPQAPAEDLSQVPDLVEMDPETSSDILPLMPIQAPKGPLVLPTLTMNTGAPLPEKITGEGSGGAGGTSGGGGGGEDVLEIEEEPDLEVIEEDESEAQMEPPTSSDDAGYELAMDPTPPSPQAAATTSGLCPSCHQSMKPGSILCMACGFNMQLGRKMDGALTDPLGDKFAGSTAPTSYEQDEEDQIYYARQTKRLDYYFPLSLIACSIIAMLFTILVVYPVENFDLPAGIGTPAAAPAGAGGAGLLGGITGGAGGTVGVGAGGVGAGGVGAGGGGRGNFRGRNWFFHPSSHPANCF